MRHYTFAAVLLSAVTLVTPLAAEDQGYPANSLLSTGTSILGEPLQYPVGSPAHVTASIVILAPGARTVTHRHGVPLFAYILQGELTVDYGARGTRVYRQGQTFMEAMAVEHHGMNNGTEPVRILAVYIGAEGAKNVIVEK
jgi:quercetin dioxygenase-like cupin family protein